MTWVVLWALLPTKTIFILLPRRRQFVYLIVGKENKGPPPQEAWQLEHVDTVASDGHRSSGSDRGHKMTRSKVKMEREMTITATSSSFSRHQIFVYLWNNLFIFGSRTALVDILICFFHPSISATFILHFYVCGDDYS